MRYCLGFLCLVVLTSANSILAANLRIAGCDVVWSSPDDPSPTCYVMVFNEQGAADSLLGWQVHLVIVPVGEVTGSVQFAWADLPRGSEEGYLLAGNSGVLDMPDPPDEPWIPGPVDELRLWDNTFDGNPIVVPESGKTLLKTSFSATPDAQGVFGIAVAADPTGYDTGWAASDYQMYGFENAPDENEPVVIGQLTVGALVPEPGNFLFICTALAMLAIRELAPTVRRR